jgi:hypothetical protein
LEDNADLRTKVYAKISLHELKHSSEVSKKTPQPTNVIGIDESSRRAREARAYQRGHIPSSEHAYRVRGIPRGYGRNETKSLLKKVLGLGSNNLGLQVVSLAIDLSGHSAVATINFEVTPESLRTGDEWSFDITNFMESASEESGDEPPTPPRIIWLTIDDHFHGFTTLSTPSPAEHKVE